MSSALAEGGISISVASGLSFVNLENPGGSSAGYKGRSLLGRVLVPVVDNGFQLQLGASYRQDNLENVISSESESEDVSLSGPGGSLVLEYQKFFVGYEHMLMTAKHRYSGAIGLKNEYKYQEGSVLAGFAIPVGAMKIGLTYSFSNARIPKAETGLSADTPRKEQAIWLMVSYTSQTQLSDIAEKFKR